VFSFDTRGLIADKSNHFRRMIYIIYATLEASTRSS